MIKILSIIFFGLLWFMPVTADDNCVDKNSEIILDLGGTTEPEKIISFSSAILILDQIRLTKIVSKSFFI